MKQENKQRSISAVTALLVLAVFAVGILGVLLTGAQAYQRLTRRNSSAYDSRTCCAYLSARFRQAPGSIQVEDFGGSDALVFYEELSGNLYKTRVYCYDGWLMELFTGASGTFSPQDGEKILPLTGLQLTQQDTLVSAQVTDTDGAVFHLMLHSPVEVLP